MDFFNDLSVPVKFLVAFVVVLAILGAIGFVVRRLGGGALINPSPRGRQPRLSVIEAASVDGRRRLVLVRRDNAEHLLLIGGPTDIVVEPNIGRAAAVAAPAPAPAPAAMGGWDQKANPMLEPAPRPTLSLEGTGWPPADPIEPQPPPRPAREAFARAPVERQRLEALVEDVGAPPLMPTPPREPDPVFEPPPIPPSFEPVFQVPPAPEPKRMSMSTPPPSRPAQSEESNLAEMAHRLESALRRPIKPVEPVPPPTHRFTSAPAPLDTPPRQPRELNPSPVPPAMAREPAPPPFPKEPPDLKVVPSDARPAPPAAPSFTSIEEEMASLLGRSTGKP
jgi:flagellar protein FliO/FliZ